MAKDKKVTAGATTAEPTTEEAGSEVEAVKQDEPAAEVEEAPKAGEDVVIKHAEMAMPDKMPTYRVKEDWRGSIGGSVGTLAKGKIINPRLYGGVEGIEKLKKMGVALEKVK